MFKPIDANGKPFSSPLAEEYLTQLSFRGEERQEVLSRLPKSKPTFIIREDGEEKLITIPEEVKTIQRKVVGEPPAKFMPFAATKRFASVISNANQVIKDILGPIAGRAAHNGPVESGIFGDVNHHTHPSTGCQICGEDGEGQCTECYNCGSKLICLQCLYDLGTICDYTSHLATRMCSGKIRSGKKRGEDCDVDLLKCRPKQMAHVISKLITLCSKHSEEGIAEICNKVGCAEYPYGQDILTISHWAFDRDWGMPLLYQHLVTNTRSRALTPLAKKKEKDLCPFCGKNINRHITRHLESDHMNLITLWKTHHNMLNDQSVAMPALHCRFCGEVNRSNFVTLDEMCKIDLRCLHKFANGQLPKPVLVPTIYHPESDIDMSGASASERDVIK